MAYPTDLWIADPNDGRLLKITPSSGLIQLAGTGPKDTTAVLVSRDGKHVYTAHASGVVHIWENGKSMDDISVGSYPCAICEDEYLNLYVANYGDNTVTKITKPNTAMGATQKTETIVVPSGPRDITIDSRNKVYVACYTSNTVAEIVNNLVTNKIQAKLSPRAIVCDVADNIWVACYGSNTVLKIVKSVVTNTYELADYGRGPVDIITDLNGDVWTANYLGNNVCHIEFDMAGNPTVNSVPVSAAPTSISLDPTIGDLYVTSEQDGVYDVIHDGSYASTNGCCTTPIGYSDATGGISYLTYTNISSTTGSLVAPVHMGDMDTEIFGYLASVRDGAVSTSADLVSYHNTAYPTVEKALDSLLNVDLRAEGTGLEIAQTMFEYGSTVTSLDISWKFNKPLAVAELRSGSVTIADLADTPGAIVPAQGSKTISGLSIKANSSLQLYVEDDQGNIAYSGIVRITFENRLIFGAIPYSGTSTILNSNILGTLTKTTVRTDPYGKHMKIDCGVTGDQTICIAVPQNWNIRSEQILVGGSQMSDDMWVDIPINHTNGAGGFVTYKAFYLDTALANTTIVEIVDFF